MSEHTTKLLMDLWNSRTMMKDILARPEFEGHSEHSYRRRIEDTLARNKDQQRSISPVDPWTEEEMQRLYELVAAERTADQISRVLNRSPPAIRHMCRASGLSPGHVTKKKGKPWTEGEITSLLPFVSSMKLDFRTTHIVFPDRTTASVVHKFTSLHRGSPIDSRPSTMDSGRRY